MREVDEKQEISLLWPKSAKLFDKTILYLEILDSVPRDLRLRT